MDERSLEMPDVEERGLATLLTTKCRERWHVDFCQ
jgi:hypothetical protein